ncbi:MAG: SGNH/GDSL hydrolase family protein [Candidatus Zixiibacteriota bacterium]
MRLRHQYVYRLAAVLLIPILFLAAAEFVVRLLLVDTYFQNRFFVLNRALDYPDVFKKDRDLFWRFRPKQVITSKFFEGKTYRINSLGLRGEEVSKIKTKPRILALGNSCTFGWRVAEHETYVERLETLLGGKYEVINAAIPGYTSLQGKRFFERELIHLNPDIVLILFAWNDHWAAANQISDKDQEFPPQLIITCQNILSRFHFYRLLKKLLLSLIEKDPDSLFDRQAPVYRVGIGDFRKNLMEICYLARSHGAIPILLTSPIPSLSTYYPPGSRSPMHRYHEKYNQVIRNLSTSEGIDLVDLAKEFDRHNDLYDDAPNDPIHFNAKGHKVAAELLTQYILERY